MTEPPCRRPRTGWSRALLALWLLLPALGACAAPPPPRPPCRSPVADALSIRQFQGHPVVTVSVNGEPVSMLLDTGAESTVLTRAAVARLRVQTERDSRAVITGIDGTRLQEVARATVGLSGRGRSLVLPVVDLPGGMEELAGVVGTDILSDYDLDLDQPGGQLTLRRPGPSCTADDAPAWPGRAVRVPAAFTPRGRVTVPVGLGRIDVHALLDTGITDAILSPDAARRAGVTDEQVAAGPLFVFVGAALQPVSMRTVRLPDVRIGPERLPELTVAVPAVPLPGVNMLLGNDYLGRRRVLISWARQAVFVQAPAP